VLGDWAKLLSTSFANVDLAARLCLMQKPARGAALLRAGAEIRAKASFFSTSSGEETYVDSSLAVLGLEAGAWAALAWPRWEATLRSGAGLAYSRIRVSGSDLAADAKSSASSVDPAASVGLELAWKPSTRLSLGLDCAGSFVFYSEQMMTSLSPGAFARLAF
jgi:hypothetical protein